MFYADVAWLPKEEMKVSTTVRCSEFSMVSIVRSEAGNLGFVEVAGQTRRVGNGVLPLLSLLLLTTFVHTVASVVCGHLGPPAVCYYI